MVNNFLEYSADNSGNTKGHILIKNKKYDEFKDYYIKNPNIISFVNNKNKNLTQICDNLPILEFIIDNTKDEYLKYFDNVDIYNKTLLLNLIKFKYNSQIKKIIKKLIKKKINLEIPLKKPPLIYATKLNNYNVVETLLKNNGDPNIKDVDEYSPLIIAIINSSYEATKLLLKYGADQYYGGLNDDEYPLNLAITNKNLDLVKLLLKYSYDLNYIDKYLNTPAHYLILSIKDAFMNDKEKLWISPSDIFNVLYYSDINKKNLNGLSTLNLMVMYNIWIYFKEIIKNNTIDDKTFDKSKEYINDKTFNNFINLFSNIKDKCHDDDMDLCKTNIKNFLINNDNSLIKLPKIVKSEYGIFDSDIVHSYIYTLILLKKYVNLGLPFQYRNNDKFINDTNTNVFLEPLYLPLRMPIQTSYNINELEGGTLSDNLMWSIIDHHKNLFYELYPYFIIWKNENLYYVDPNLDLYTKKILNYKKIRYIIFKLTLITQYNTTHANIILYDKVKNELIRFEPYGIEIQSSDSLNDMLKKLFKKCINKDIKFLFPDDYLHTTKFQSVSNDTDDKIKKRGDPAGYCLAWTFWFIELKLKNPDVDTKMLVKDAFNKIIKHPNPNNQMLDHIRDYAKKLDQEKNNFLLHIGVDRNFFYNIEFPDTIMVKIITGVIEEFINLMKKHEEYKI